jgi:DNA polymerase-3 subunit gamma/tau
LVTRENIEADNDALALLAEAGDGSMRDALSILDQAIASASGRLTADSVRNLVGAAPAHILEEVMQAIARGTSDEVLRQVDHLISEGHSPTHFARQMVRFLRNATVAKIAGKDSSLLQISSEERERVARVAELFGEEDLTRHLQIMLRTHGELGYKQEQRFHLELGLLKMSHAQRLLPMEQLLSDVASAPNAATPRTPSRPAIVGGNSASAETRRQEPPAVRPNYVSPFAADSARKGTPRQESSSEPAPSSGPRIVSASASAPVIMGSAAPADLNDPEPAPQPISNRRDVASYVSAATIQTLDTTPPQPEASAVPPQTQPSPSPAQSDLLDKLQAAVLQALADGNQRILVSMLEAGEWSVQANEVVIKIAESQTLIDMSLSPEARRLAIASASGVLGRAVKLRIVPGATLAPEGKRNGSSARPASSNANPATGRSRAEHDPVVQRMREKFGAEIRTVIDYKEKR